MDRILQADHGLIHAEALTFALARRMPRPDAAAAVKALCDRAQATGKPLSILAAQDFPDLDWTPGDLGSAPTEAAAFAARVRAVS
jgi:3-carboxy-cis,cis-muconate cycloisomerase